MSSAAFLFWCQVLTIAGLLLTVLKLWRTGLYRRYRMFFLLFLFQVPNSIWPLLVDIRSRYYEHLWICTEPIAQLLNILVVAELYRLVLEKHKGLYSLGRWVMYPATAIAVGISILTLLPHFKPDTPQQSRVLGFYYATERGADCTLVIFILLILLFLSRYPISLSRNVLVHSMLFAIFFLSTTLGLLLLTIFGHRLYEEINMLMMGLAAACTFAWFFLLSSQGEETRTNIPLFGPDDERRALERLDAINATLLRVSRN